jgi:hypothetical protein
MSVFIQNILQLNYLAGFFAGPVLAYVLHCITSRADINMSRNIIIAVTVIGALTLSAASQERRAEIVIASRPAFTAVKRKLPDDGPPHIAMAGASAEDAHILPDLVAAPPVIPLGPHDLLRAYELAMASIAERLSMDLAGISNAVGTGQLTREQGEFASGEQYQVGIMQFQLLKRTARNACGGYLPNAARANRFYLVFRW